MQHVLIGRIKDLSINSAVFDKFIPFYQAVYPELLDLKQIKFRFVSGTGKAAGNIVDLPEAVNVLCFPVQDFRRIVRSGIDGLQIGLGISR